jgi:hypothetical protein
MDIALSQLWRRELEVEVDPLTFLLDPAVLAFAPATVRFVFATAWP